MKQIGSLCLLVLGACLTARAEPPVGVTPNVIGRGTYGAYNVQAADPRTVDFSSASTRPVDIVVRTHDYAPGSSTGWHTHPGPVFITVVEGTLTFYEYDDKGCSAKVVSKGQGYVDSGRGHIARNESAAPAKDVSVIVAPVGQPFRGELSAPAPNCRF
jgi:oxalate decarboxylase/phosphoglucose isomerase-like protein (cupin superfamily)